jgi:hypothetical protein
MNNKLKYELNDLQIVEWYNKPTINPKTKRKIKVDGPVYKKLKKYNSYDKYLIKKKILEKNKEEEEEDKNEIITDRYITYRREKIDPLLYESIPLLKNMTEDDLYKFEYKWNPYTGIRTIIDSNGPLWFDPDTLIHHFYISRLRGLWTSGYYETDEIANEEIWNQGMYGDCVGNGPDFNNNSRGGKHQERYLFRLPIPDCYLPENHFRQAITMGPILNDKEIIEIYKLANKYGNNYEKRFNKKRPKLKQMKKWYEIAISKTPEKLTNYVTEGLEGDILNEIREEINRNYVDLLKKM